MNLNDLARRIALKEGGKVNLSIAQVKEVLRLALEELAKREEAEVIRTLRRYRKWGR